jgi:serine protease AprX
MRYSILGATPEQVRQAGGTNIKLMKSIGVIYADMSPQQAVMLERRHGAAVKIDRDTKLHVTPPTPVPASTENSLTPEAILAEVEFAQWKNLLGLPMDGAGLDVAILDTGIRKTHVKLGDIIVYEEDFSGSSSPTDIYDHGTGVADVVHTMAPASKILNMKVINDAGLGSEEAVVSAIERCIEMHEQQYEYAPNFICLSLGSEDDGNHNNPIRLACRYAIDTYNIWIAAAAGNDGPGDTTITCPATEQYVCAVGACSLPDTLVESYSSRGPTKEGLVKPDVVYIGKDVLVASCKSDTATKAASGTSFATPFIIGMTDLFRQVCRAEATHQSAFAFSDIPYLQRSLNPPTDPTMQIMIDEYCPIVCLKPGDAAVTGHLSTKDNTYGYGTPFATLAQRFMKAAGTSAVVESIVTPLMTIMGMGMMMSMMQPMIKNLTKGGD